MPDRDSQIVEMWRRGLSFAEIANCVRLTRAAVIAILSRPTVHERCLPRACEQLAPRDLQRVPCVDRATPNGWLRYAELYAAERGGERVWYWRNRRVRV